MAQFLVIQNLLRGAVEGHLAGIENDGAIRELECGQSILLDDPRRDARLLHFLQDSLDFIDDRWRKTFVGFIEQQKFDVAREGPRHGEHLLFTTGQRYAFLLASLS